MPVELRYSGSPGHFRADKPCSPSQIQVSSPGKCTSSPSGMCRVTPEYNLSLSEMRHYKDEDTMVLVLSQNNLPAEEAEYPIPIERDTSELLDADDDDTLAGYAEAASRLIKPSPLQLPHYDALDSFDAETPSHLFYNDDVSHESFGGQSFEPSQEYLGHVRSYDELDPETEVDRRANASNRSSPRGFFSLTEPSSGPVVWSDSPVVHQQPWMFDDPDDPDPLHGYDKDFSSSPQHDHVDYDGPTRAETSEMRGRAFSPTSSRGSSSRPRVHNGSLMPFSKSFNTNGATAQSHNGASRNPISSSRVHNGASSDQQTHKWESMEAQRSNSAASRRSRAARTQQRRAALEQKHLSANEHQAHLASNEAGDMSHEQGKPFWPEISAEARAHDPAERQSTASLLRDTPGYAGIPPTAFFAERTQNGIVAPDQTQASLDVDAFSSPPTPQVPESTAAEQEGDISGHDKEYSAARFFEMNQYQEAKSPSRDSACVDSSLIQDARGVHSHNGAYLRAGELNSVISLDPSGLDPRKGNHKEVEQDSNASRSFARAVTHSSLPSALPEYSTRRSEGPPRNSAMRRSSRRDAHMQQRIANLDTSDLSQYSLPTLQRLAKDMALSNFSRLSKSELVVQLVAEIILANMSLGRTIPEVQQGQLHSSDAAVDEDASGAEAGGIPGTMYKFDAESGGSGKSNEHWEEQYEGVVEVEDDVSGDKMQRGRGALGRLKSWLPKMMGGDSEQPLPEAQPVSVRNSPVQECEEGFMNVDEDFESLARLSMSQLQELCEDVGVERWQHMRKNEMVGSLLMHVYECN